MAIRMIQLEAVHSSPISLMMLLSFSHHVIVIHQDAPSQPIHLFHHYFHLQHPQSQQQQQQQRPYQQLCRRLPMTFNKICWGIKKRNIMKRFPRVVINWSFALFMNNSLKKTKREMAIDLVALVADYDWWWWWWWWWWCYAIHSIASLQQSQSVLEEQSRKRHEQTTQELNTLKQKLERVSVFHAHIVLLLLHLQYNKYGFCRLNLKPLHWENKLIPSNSISLIFTLVNHCKMLSYFADLSQYQLVMLRSFFFLISMFAFITDIWNSKQSQKSNSRWRIWCPFECMRFSKKKKPIVPHCLQNWINSGDYKRLSWWYRDCITIFLFNSLQTKSDSYRSREQSRSKRISAIHQDGNRVMNATFGWLL